MGKCLLGRRTAARVDLQQGLQKTEEVVVVSPDPLLEGRLLGNEDVVESIFFIKNEVFFAEVVLHFGSVFKHPLWPGSQNALDPGQHARKVYVVEEDIFGPKLSQDASNTPDVDLDVIAVSEDYFWSPVAPGLHVGPQGVMNEARIAKIDDLDFHWGIRLNEHIFGF